MKNKDGLVEQGFHIEVGRVDPLEIGLPQPPQLPKDWQPSKVEVKDHHPDEGETLPPKQEIEIRLIELEKAYVAFAKAAYDLAPDLVDDFYIEIQKVRDGLADTIDFRYDSPFEVEYQRLEFDIELRRVAELRRQELLEKRKWIEEDLAKLNQEVEDGS